MNLSEFVSDYWNIYKETGGSKPTAREVAEAFIDNNGVPEGKSQDEYERELVPQIRYYMP